MGSAAGRVAAHAGHDRASQEAMMTDLEGDSMRFADLRRLWRSDLYRHYGRANLGTFTRMLLVYWEPPGAKYAFLLRLCRYTQEARPRALFAPLFVITRILLKRWEYAFHIRIPPQTAIGPGLYIGHFGDIGVNRRAVIGANCNLSQGVSIGQASRGRRKGCPVIGDNVFVGPGAKIIGRVRIGDNVAIGANCVVTRDIPDNAVVVGVPGRVISYAGSADYILNTDYDAGPAASRADTGEDHLLTAEATAPQCASADASARPAASLATPADRAEAARR